MSLDVVIAFIAILAGPITAAVTWKLSKRKNEADTDSSIATGATMAVETMVKVMQELREQVSILSMESASLKVENQELRLQIATLKVEIAKLMAGGHHDVQ